MFLLIDKPAGITSHDVVNRVRSISGERRVGHAGTLDPLATGLLIVGVGREATKQLGMLARRETKTYEAEITLGEERETDDAEGMVIAKAKSVLPPSRREVERVLHQFLGTFSQVPPRYSAIKLGGQPAYRLARQGRPFQLKPRRITVFRMRLTSYRYPRLRVQTTVSAGTYIRALARDLGRRLGMGAYLSQLRRTQVGKFRLAKAVTLEKLTWDHWQRYLVDSVAGTAEER